MSEQINPIENEPKRTPLYDRHVAAGAKMVPFGGWEMPLHYGSQLEEHMATRKGVTLFDVSHMGQVMFTGPGALDLVQRIVTRDAATLTDGEEGYALLCDENGGLLDDLFVARLGAEEFLLVVNAATYEDDVAAMDMIATVARIPNAKLTPCTEDWAMIAVQGPRWVETCRAAIDAENISDAWATLPRNRVAKLIYGGRTMLLSTTGYTGEKGCEMLCHPGVAEPLWDALVKAGGRPAGLAARDSLRLEMGYCLSGQDFTSENNPFEARVTWAMNLGKPSDFQGKSALQKIKAAGVKKKLVGLAPEGKRIPRHGAAILSGGAKVGEVTSGGYSPILEKPIAMGYVALPHDALGTTLEINLGRITIPAVVTKVPFCAAGS